MKRMIYSSVLTEDELLDLMDEAVSAIKSECEKRNQDEYVDDLKWGKDRFEVPIFVSPTPSDTHEVAVFRFIYDEDEEGSIEEQMHLRLDEFIQDWNYDADDEMTGEELIDDILDEVVFECLEKYRKTKSQDEIISIVEHKLAKPPYNLVKGEDFTTDAILEVMNDYKYYWS